MPDQPVDPLHYSMKIPPEPRPDEEGPAGGAAPAITPRAGNSGQINEDVAPSARDANNADEQKK